MKKDKFQGKFTIKNSRFIQNLPNKKSIFILNEMVDCNLLIVGSTNVDLKLYTVLKEIVKENNHEDKVVFVGYNTNLFHK